MNGMKGLKEAGLKYGVIQNHIGEAADEGHGQRQRLTKTPLPVKQLAILCFIRMTEPISYTVIFPFISQMIEDLGISSNPSQVGSYAGLIEGAFALSQLFTALIWGSLSDQFGRKPILNLGLLGLSIGMTFFGFQKTWTGLMAARLFAGVMNGNISVVKSVIAEITDETNQAAAFVLPPAAYALGLSIGPAIGGYCAKPAEQYPSIQLFQSYPIFTDYPYMFPCLIVGLLNLTAFLFGVFYLDETLPKKAESSKRWSYTKCSAQQPSVNTPLVATARELAVTSPKASTPTAILLSKPVLKVMLSLSLLSIQNATWQALIPMFTYTSIQNGGLGMSMNQIGSILGLGGMIALVNQTCFFSPLQLRLGTITLYRIVAIAFPLSLLSLPWIRALALTSAPDSSSRQELCILGLVINLILKGVANLSIVCITLLINNSAPTQSSLGTIHGFSQSCSSLARTLGPGMTGFLFSESVRTQSSGIWYVLLMIGAASYWTTWIVEDRQPEWRKRPMKQRPTSGLSIRYGSV